MVVPPKTHYSSKSDLTACACNCPAVNQCLCPVAPVVSSRPPVGAPAHRVLVVVNGPRPDAVVAAHGGLPDQVRAALDRHGFDKHTVDIDVHTAYEDGASSLPENAHMTYVAVFLGGSKYDVTDNAPWMIAMADWLRRHVGRLPILGICFGHQILGHALGGTVEKNVKGWEQGSYTLERTNNSMSVCDPLVNQLPVVLPVQLQHGQSVTRLPKGAISFYNTPTEANQFVRFAPMAYGVQFHPEFDGATMRTYLSVCGMSGVNRALKFDTPVDTELATSIIPRFTELAIAFATSTHCYCE